MNVLKSWKPWVLVAVSGACFCVPLFVHNNYLIQVLFRVALFAALGLAWNLVGGYAGQLSLGHAAFFGVGAYGMALFANHSVPKWIAVLLAALVSAAFAAIIGSIAFRLRGPYFTLATIAFGEVLRLTVTNLEITGGAIGLTLPGLFTGRTFWRSFYLAAVALALLAFLTNFWVARSRFGYYLMAIREDEETASAVGINTARCKLQSLLLSAFLTALAGALYGSAFQYLVPDSVLNLEISVQVAIIAMLGGAGTLLGPIVGAVLLLTASEVFKNQFKESHLLIYGILIVVVVLFMPEGIVGGLQHRFRRKEKPPSSLGTQDVQQAGARGAGN
ncbi:MAG TPA: branched-chain amino acid ABC transporter permease [Alphaproteobacteria bacterium]|nr:branched-chain amino acid ABC transporter permease [Alphaproteobacteria bacterium]